jgi:DNA-binding SARP family transcriptional activator/ATP/maltotriose-dependent transcriptional regulator MalT
VADRSRRLLPRPLLEHRLDAALTHRLTTLTAAPGYGKSVLLERWGSAVGAVTHRLVPEDRQLLHLVERVTAALRLRAPGLSAEHSAVLAAPLGPDGAADPGSRAAALAGTLSAALQDALRRHLVLILEDVDVLGPDDPGTRFLDALLRSAPHRLHLVTASRTPVPVPVERLRQRDQIVELTATDLTLDLDETRTWAATLADEHAVGLAEEVLDRTGGWPIAAAATLEQLAAIAPGDRRSWLARSDPMPVVEGLVLRAYEEQPEEVRELLRAGTVTPTLTEKLADELGLPGDALDELHRRGSLLDADVGTPTTYRLTPAARQAIERRHGLSPQEAERLTEHAAGFYATHGETGHALRCLLSGGGDDALARLLHDHRDALEGPATADVVLLAIESLPDERATSPPLRRLAGIAHQARGDWERARTVLSEVAETDAFDAGVAWRLGLNLHLRGELGAALDVYERGAAASRPPADAAICAAWAASARWLRGERDACARQADDAMTRATALDDPRALAAAHMVMAMLAALDGDRRANDAHYLRAIEHAERAGDMLQLIRIRSNRASHHLEEGSFQDALAELEVARRLADLTGFTPFGALTLSNRAEALVGVGRLEEAAVDAADAVAAWRSLGSRLAVYGLEKQARIQRLRGDTTGAVATYREAIAESEAIEDLQGLVPNLAALAELVVDEDPDEAWELARRAVGHGDGMGHVAAHLAATHVAIETGRTGEAHRHLEIAAAAAEQRRDRPGLARAAHLRARLTGELRHADEACDRWEELGDLVQAASAELTRARLAGGQEAGATAERVRVRLHAIGCRAFDDRIHALLSHAGPERGQRLVLHTLGGFRVLRDGVPVPRTAWQSRKARDLVKLLASRRGRPVPREWLVEHLWPDADPTTAGKRLNVMASTVRGVLDPDRQWPSDHVLVTDGDALCLDLRHVELDVDRFLTEVDTAARLDREGSHDAALDCWRRAERRYTGEFCEDDPYAEWPVGIREEARAAYAQVVARLADEASHAGRDDEAVRLWLRLLERDAYDERAHLALVAALVAADRHGDARRRYQTYVGRIRELGVEPAPFPDDGRRGPATHLNST